MNFTETEEQQALRRAVVELGKRYGHEYTAQRARQREPLSELWNEAGKSGFIGVNLPEEFGGRKWLGQQVQIALRQFASHIAPTSRIWVYCT